MSAVLFDHVQQELKARKECGHSGSGDTFANCIVCGDCGRFFGRKLWHSTGKYRCTVWQCNWKFKNEKQCNTPHLKQEDIENAFIEAFNKTLERKDEILEDFEHTLGFLTDCADLEQQIREVDSESDILEAAIEKFIKENALPVMNQSDYNIRYGELASRYEALRTKREELNSEITLRRAKRSAIRYYMKALKKQNKILTKFSPGLWRSVVDKLVVLSGHQAVFHFKDGSLAPWNIQYGNVY